MEANAIKKRIDEIRREQVGIEKIIAKQEEDDIFDDSLYDKIEELESEKDKLEDQLSKLEIA